MYSHQDVSPEVLDLLVQEINQRLGKAETAPQARVEEYNRGTERWSWSFLWQSRLKVADVRMFANNQAVRLNFLYLGEKKDARNWFELMRHEDDPAWNEALKYMSDLGQLSNWTVIIQALERRLAAESP